MLQAAKVAAPAQESMRGNVWKEGGDYSFYHWNSCQGCFASQLRIQSACKTFLSKHEDSGIPAALMVWKDSNYWHGLEEAELLIHPFCDASFLMQREANTMAHVMLVLLNLSRHIFQYCGDNLASTPMLADLENRWKEAENPLFFLAFALHPTYRATAVQLVSESETQNGNWSKDQNCLSVARLVDAAKFYYEKYELHDEDANEEEREKALHRLGKDLKKWLLGVSKFDPFEPGENSVEWWGLEKSEHPEIANLSMFLLDAPVQAATCERLFKEFARLHTKLRNRLKPTTTHEMAQVKYNLKRKYPEDLSEKASLRNKKGGQAPKNHAISANHHVRIDAPLSPGLPADTSQDAIDVSDEEESDEEEEEEEESAELETIDQWLAALTEAVPDDDDDFFYDSLEPKDVDSSDSDSDDDEVPDCFEKRRQNLPVLPEQNDVNWPQENKHYFARQTSKKYVRTDKYSLLTMYALCAKLPEGSELPSIMSAYEKRT
jgi:hypothetical protein